VGTSLARPATLTGLLATARRLRAQRVAIVHGYLYEGNILGMLAGRLAGVPIRIASKRSLDHYPRRAQRLATRLANACAHRIVCNAEAVSRVVREEERPAPEKLLVIPNGIPVDVAAGPAERPAGVPVGARLVGMVGRLSWKKAVHHFLEAARRVREVRDDVAFVLVGDGPLRGALESEAARLGIGPHVHFLGERPAARALLGSLDVLVVSSVIEGMPNVVLEALAAERPVVATRVGGIPEILTHEESGLLVPPADPPALAAAVLRLLARPEEAAAFGAAGRRTVEARFSVEAMAARFAALYDELLGVHPAPAPASTGDEAMPTRAAAGAR
jgi:glycosyltransferase involved in cell wall biosynthesis